MWHATMGLLKRADRSVLGGATTVEDGKHYEEASEDLASVQREIDPEKAQQNENRKDWGAQRCLRKKEKNGKVDRASAHLYGYSARANPKADRKGFESASKR